MTIITVFVIPFCFGFIAARAFKNRDKAIVGLAIIGFIADLVLIILTMR